MSINITDEAYNELLEVMKDSGLKKPALRVSFNGFGWGGPRLGLVLDELEENEKFTLKEKDIDVVYDERIEQYLKTQSAITVDFRKDRYGSGFVILGGSTC